MAKDTGTELLRRFSQQQLVVQRHKRERRNAKQGMMLVRHVTASDVYLPPKNQIGTRRTYGTQHRVVVIKTAENLSQEVAY